MRDALSDSSSQVRPIVVLIPVYRDWEAVAALLPELDDALACEGQPVRVLLVDDGSPDGGEPDIPVKLNHIDQVEVLRLRRNLGHQRAIAVGLTYLQANLPCEAVVVMDGDGEDAPGDVPRLLEAMRHSDSSAIQFAERTRRSESLAFRIGYHSYRWLHWLLTGVRVRVGNFSAIPGRLLDRLVAVSEIWNHYAAGVFRSRLPYQTVPTSRAHRLHGQSRMNLTALVVHGLSAISVFGDIIGVRLLIASMLMLVLGGAAGIGLLGVKLLTDLAIPGWTSTVGGLLLIGLMQLSLMAIGFAFMTLGSRSASTFIPLRDYSYFVERIESVDTSGQADRQATADRTSPRVRSAA